SSSASTFWARPPGVDWSVVISVLRSALTGSLYLVFLFWRAGSLLTRVSGILHLNAETAERRRVQNVGVTPLPVTIVAAQAAAIACVLPLRPDDRHTAGLEGFYACRLPAGLEVRLALAFGRCGILFPGCGEEILPLDEPVVVRLVLRLPDADLLIITDRALVERHDPFELLVLERPTSGTRGGILVVLIQVLHGLGHRIDLIGIFVVICHQDRIWVCRAFERLVLADRDTFGAGVLHVVRSRREHPLPASFVVVR